MHLYHCEWRRGTEDAQPFILTKTGRMRLTRPKRLREAYSAFDALCGVEDEPLETLRLHTEGHTTHATLGKMTWPTEEYVFTALFYHCFPHTVGMQVLPMNAYLWSDLKVVDFKHGALYPRFHDAWWNHVYRAGEALTADNGLVLGIERWGREMPIRHVLRLHDRYQHLFFVSIQQYIGERWI